MKNDIGDPRQRRWPLRDLLVGAQIAVSVVLLACSGLMLRSLNNAMSVQLGFNTQSAAMLGFDLTTQGYSDPKALEFQKKLLQRVREMPGIVAAATAGPIPLDLGFSNNTVWETGQPEPPGSKVLSAYEYQAGPDFFRAMGTRLIAGREFEERDDKSRKPRVLVVNQQFAQF
jgi:hypothetical protein